ncbi:TetR/AcrR family transcriptional regulator [Actinoplanes flavus]|uniref:TetR family transcriptional regulator n=1 Tax=Actinoplanes flavus TaxID=2820290 RepID=A0ABS3UUJ5_9ACTN|nr:TetR/AcrR family transcriptional regulator [Actinoplanes flavus]MBO3742263.1 TetR family transcriptional regulator [Actinoplanes flavus]
MGSRRDELLDAAIEVLGQSGIHGLTHRRVDAAAGLPAGSTSNLFRTRDALLEAVAERFTERETANWERLAFGVPPATPREFALLMTLFAREATGPSRTLTLARYAMLVEAGIQPELRARLRETGGRVNTWFMAWLRFAGSTDPERHAPILMNHWTGAVLHELAMPDPDFDPSAQFTALAEAVLTP